MCATTASTIVIADRPAIFRNIYLYRLVRSLKCGVCSPPVWWLICLVWAGVLTWDSRHYTNPDGLSYLDLASEAASGHPVRLLNGCWSPGYPALISIALWVVRPSASQEFPLIHFINYVIFAATLWAFSLFLKVWLTRLRHIELTRGAERTLIPFAFCAFLWFTLDFSAVGLITPDLCVAAIVFCASAICCRLALPQATGKHYVTLGLVLAAGYYLKAAMLPLGFALLGLLFFALPRGRSRLKLIVSAIVFVSLSVPLVAMMSHHTGRLTYGDAGRLNYLWDVNQIPDVGWIGDGRGTYGTLTHPPRTLLSAPRTIEFSSHRGDTYPLWDDPSYWYAGAIPRFNIRQQLGTIRKTLRSYELILSQTAVLAVGAVILFVWSLQERVLPALPSSAWWQLAWPMVACSMYALVHVDHRYISPFLLLLCVTVYGGFSVRLRGAWPILATCALTLMFTFTTNPLVAALHVMRDVLWKGPPVVYETVAKELTDLGLRSGDRLALVGSAFSGSDTYPYYARIDRLQVVAQVPDENSFWRLSRPELKLVENSLSAAGVKAVIAINRPESLPQDGWKVITVSGGARFNILLLPDDNPSNH
jgi:hypothetical protein